MQPALAILFGLFDGRRDAHLGREPILAGARQERREQGRHLAGALRRVLVPLCMALALSMLFQWIIHHHIRLLPALLFAALFVALPYLVARRAAHALDGWWHRGHPRSVQAGDAG